VTPPRDGFAAALLLADLEAATYSVERRVAAVQASDAVWAAAKRRGKFDYNAVAIAAAEAYDAALRA